MVKWFLQTSHVLLVFFVGALLFVFWECRYSIYTSIKHLQDSDRFLQRNPPQLGTSKEGHLTPEKHLVGGWTNPSEKYARQIGKSSPIFGVNIFETTTLGTHDTQRILFENVHFLLDPRNLT